MVSAILGTFPLQFFELLDVMQFLKIFLLSESMVVRSKETVPNICLIKWSKLLKEISD